MRDFSGAGADRTFTAGLVLSHAFHGETVKWMGHGEPGFELSHPWHKYKDVPRMGCPSVFD